MAQVKRVIIDADPGIDDTAAKELVLEWWRTDKTDEEESQSKKIKRTGHAPSSPIASSVPVQSSLTHQTLNFAYCTIKRLMACKTT